MCFYAFCLYTIEILRVFISEIHNHFVFFSFFTVFWRVYVWCGGSRWWKQNKPTTQCTLVLWQLVRKILQSTYFCFIYEQCVAWLISNLSEIFIFSAVFFRLLCRWWCRWWCRCCCFVSKLKVWADVRYGITDSAHTTV